MISWLGLSRVYAHLVMGVLIMVLLSACAGMPQSRQLFQEPPSNISPRIELTHVPFFPQRKYQCGPAALAMVLSAQGSLVKPDDLTSKVYLPKRKGSLQIEMVAAGRSEGLLAYRLEPDLNTLFNEINHGNPVLVFQNLTFSFWPQWHYAVVVGYDLDAAELVLRSGTKRRHRLSFSTFERTWQRAGYWAYVFVRPGEIPVTAQPLEYTRAVYDLSTSGFSGQALIAMRGGGDRWPDQSVILMALANAEYEANNIDNAERIFRREIKLHPDNASAWNNLAYTLVTNKCKSSAIEAINCALLLSPGNENIQQSVVEIQGLADGAGKDMCDGHWELNSPLCRID